MDSKIPKRRIGLLIWMIISQLLMVASLLIWLFIVMVLFVMASEVGTQKGWIEAIAVGFYPVIPLTIVTGAWLAYSRQKNTLAAILSG